MKYFFNLKCNSLFNFKGYTIDKLLIFNKLIILQLKF